MTDYTPPTIGSSSWGGPLNDIIEEIDVDMQARALDSAVVHNSGNEAITGVKSFASAPSVPDASFAIAKVSGLQAALDALTAGVGVSAVNDVTGAVTLIEGDGIELVVDGQEITITASASLAGTGSESVAIGTLSEASAANTVAIGYDADATGSNAIAIGRLADAAASFAAALGYQAVAPNFASTALGSSTSASEDYATAVGSNASATGEESTAIGTGADVNALNATAIGSFAQSLFAGSTAVGAYAETTATAQVMLGQNTDTVTVPGKLQVALRTPASASATGVAGEICADASYIYVCTATNTWKRVAISTW